MTIARAPSVEFRFGIPVAIGYAYHGKLLHYFGLEEGGGAQVRDMLDSSSEGVYGVRGRAPAGRCDRTNYQTVSSE